MEVSDSSDGFVIFGNYLRTNYRLSFIFLLVLNVLELLRKFPSSPRVSELLLKPSDLSIYH